MATKITSSSPTQNVPKRLLMPHKLLKAAIDGNETDLRQLLGLNDEDDHPLHTNISVEDITPIEPSDCLRKATVFLKKLRGLNDDKEAYDEEETPMEPSDCLRSITGMENTILHILSANGHGNLVSTICSKDSSWLKDNSLLNDSSLLKVRNVRMETTLHHAARFGHENIILMLIEHAKLEFGEAGLKELLRLKNCLGETALHEAARHGHGAVVSALIEEDMELASLVNDDSVSPLYLATARGSLDMVHNMVAKMLNHEITPDFYSGPKKQTALHAAVLQNSELTKELLRLYSAPLGKGADETGRTPFHLAASAGNHKIAKLLLGKDRSLAYIQDSDGSFPVHTAVRMGHIEMISLLLHRCLDSGELLDGNGRNFLHIAIEAKKAFVIFKVLRVSKNKFLFSHWKKMFNRMVNTMDNKGNTPLHLAAEHDNVMLFLLENNELDLTLQNRESLTAVNMWSTFRELSTCAKSTTESLTTKAQLVGLGSVLIATVTFAAAFTLPGGTNQDTGTPILGKKKFVFRAFIFADFFAFLYSFKATMSLIYSSQVHNSDTMERCIAFSMNDFTVAAQCMVIALGLGLYLVLAPIENIGTIVLGLAVFITIISNLAIFKLQSTRRLRVQSKILKHIQDLNPKNIIAFQLFLRHTLWVINWIQPYIFIIGFTLLSSIENHVKY